jgi:hypothetical protein
MLLAPHEGRLGDDDQTIGGRWWIDADPASGARRTEGAFLLRGARGGEIPGEPTGRHRAGGVAPVAILIPAGDPRLEARPAVGAA